MKKLFLVTISIIGICSSKTFAQQKADSCCLSKQDIVGIWQRNTDLVGSGLNQNFEFFADGNFILNLGNNGDDVINVIQLKGKYRLDKSKLFFTITSRTVVEGQIGVADAGVSLSIFELRNGKEKEMAEINPKEISDPCYITFFGSKHIKLSNEVYFKIK